MAEEVKEKEKEKQAEKGPSEPKKAGDMRRNLILAGIVAGVNIVLLGLFYLFIMAPVQKKIDNEDEIRKKAEEIRVKKEREEATRMGAISDTISVIVNPPPPDQESFVRAAFILEYDDKDLLLGGEVKKRLPRIKNIIIRLLSSATLADLRSKEGKERLCIQLANEANKIFPDSKTIIRAYLVDFVIQ